MTSEARNAQVTFIKKLQMEKRKSKNNEKTRLFNILVLNISMRM